MWKNGAPDRVDCPLHQFVGNHDLWLTTGGEVPFQLIGEVMNVDHRLLDAGGRDAIEHVVDERPPADAHERLRDRVGDRPHALPDAGGEHHRGTGRGALRLFGGWNRLLPLTPAHRAAPARPAPPAQPARGRRTTP